MSPLSNPDRPYRSQVFNLLNRQYFRLRDRAQISFRKLKTATIWGLQLIAYPLYLLMQTSTELGKQLQSKAFKLLSPAKEKTSESVGSQPTVVALNSLHPWLEDTSYQIVLSTPNGEMVGEQSPEKHVNRDSASQQQQQSLPNQQETANPTYLIQGIGTYLETGKLVLVSTENQAIDLLSDPQHQQLKQRIKILLECYEQIQTPWWWRFAFQRDKGHFPPLRWLSIFLIWIQTSSLAKRLNLFQESQLTFFSSHYEDISQVPPHPPQTKSGGIMAKLDRILARWETTQLSPVVEQIKHWRQQLNRQDIPNPVLSIIQAAVDYFYGANPQKRLTDHPNADIDAKATRKIPKLLQPINPLIQGTKGIVNRATVAKSTRDPYSLRNLIQAAIAYFFGKPDHRLVDSGTELSATESSSEPWLTKADLFGDSDASSTTAPDTNDDFSIAVMNQLSSEREGPSTTAETIGRTDSAITESDTVEEQWQTEAIPMGYEKHILARILEGIDRVLAWLEDRLLKLWQWLTQWFPKN